MSSLEAEIDASFYNLVHQLSVSAGGAVAERRHERRSRFVATQRIALCQPPRIPEDDEFIDVPCHDLTCKGFSFFLPVEPDFQVFVVALGARPNVIYMSAGVTHSEPVLVYDSGLIERFSDGSIPAPPTSSSVRRMVRVGCTFIERLTASRKALPVVE